MRRNKNGDQSSEFELKISSVFSCFFHLFFLQINCFFLLKLQVNPDFNFNREAGEKTCVRNFLGAIVETRKQ